jgi:hypothetical protein
MTLPIAIAALTVLLMLGVGSAMTTIGPWYRDLRKPGWNPDLRARVDRDPRSCRLVGRFGLGERPYVDRACPDTRPV